MSSGLLMAFLLGLTGSLGQCMGMCGGIGIFLNLGKSPGRRLSVRGRLVVTHLGRITTYMLIGALSGMLGGALTVAFSGMGLVQGALAIVAAVFAGPRIEGPMPAWHEEPARPADAVAEVEGEHKTPGTLVLALVFLLSFAVYYFANWMWLADVWEVR